jgi:AcrR family transcriptional regulator
MTVQPYDGAKARIVNSARETFVAHGYEHVTMAQLAEACGLTRRGLYHHFSHKEDVYRATLRLGNVEAFERGDQAASVALARGASALDVLSEWLDARFGETRRLVGNSPHGRELNEVAFRVGTDIMIEVSYESNRKLAELIDELCRRGLLKLRSGVTAEKLGRLIGDGARGVNQARPPIPNSLIAQHYRDVTEVILYGCAEPP